MLSGHQYTPVACGRVLSCRLDLMHALVLVTACDEQANGRVTSDAVVLAKEVSKVIMKDKPRPELQVAKKDCSCQSSANFSSAVASTSPHVAG